MSDTQTYERKKFEAGARLLRQGEKNGTAYLIDEGRVRVFIEKDGRVVDLAELGPGQIVGEMSLLTGSGNGASVEALETVSASVITREALGEKIAACDPLVRSLLRMLVERVQSADTALLDSETREFIEIDLI